MFEFFSLLFSGAFSTIIPVGGLENCQEVLCANVYKEYCHSFIYSRLDDACSIYFSEIDLPDCDIHSGVPQDNLSECDNPEVRLEVSWYHNSFYFWMYLSYMNHTLSCSFSLNLSADMRATY